MIVIAIKAIVKQMHRKIKETFIISFALISILLYKRIIHMASVSEKKLKLTFFDQCITPAQRRQLSKKQATNKWAADV